MRELTQVEMVKVEGGNDSTQATPQAAFIGGFAFFALLQLLFVSIQNFLHPVPPVVVEPVVVTPVV